MEKASILIVDDEEIYRDLLSEYLTKRYKDRGIKVLTAQDGQDAMGVAQRHPIDLVISDYHMPNMNGLDLFKNLKKVSNETEVVFISGDQDAAPNLHDCGAYHVLLKPFRTLDDLGQVADRALKKKGLLSQIKENVQRAGEAAHGSKAPTREVVTEIIHEFSDEVLDKLEASTANESQRQLVRDFSHEARGHFTVLQGYMELLEESSEENMNEDQLEMVKKVRCQLQKFANYVSQFVETMRSEIPGGHAAFIQDPTKLTKKVSKKSMHEIISQISQVFQGVLFDNRLTIDINLEPGLQAPMNKAPKIKLILISLVTHLAKVIDESHMVLNATQRGKNLSLRCECYMTDEGYDLGKLLETGCLDITRLLREIDGSMKVTSISKYQANVEFLIPNK